MNVIGLGYIAIEAQDKVGWGAFATNVLGMAVAPSISNSRYDYYKVDERAYRVMVFEGTADRLAFAGWEVSSIAALNSTKVKLETAGVIVADLTADECSERGVGAAFTSIDPCGNAFEIFCNPIADSVAFVSPVGVSEFIMGDMGMGHVVLPAPDIEKTYAFYSEMLGFDLSDELNIPMGPEGPILGLKFMHAANPRHHSLALFEGPHPGGCIHWMLEVPDMDTVGHCMDRADAAGVPLFASLGRHSNDNMLSVYFMSAGGIGVEYGCEGHRMDWTGWKPKVLESGDIWGHAYQMIQE